MSKITDFCMGNRLKLTDIDGDTFSGIATAILWEDEAGGEACIVLDDGEREVAFNQSDVVSIEKI